MAADEYEITDRGRAVVEAGLTLRQAHEIEHDCSAEHLCEECRAAIT